MANSQYEYVKSYEIPDPLMPNTFAVIRVDGHAFTKFCHAHQFEKPNDIRALDLMNRAAKAVMQEFPDIVLAFGESDEYSFLMRRDASVYGRRRSKINSTVASIFTSNYVFYWNEFFPNTPLRYPPTFDSRVVLYPTAKEVRDYFSWRQVDTHINNLHNTCYWALRHDGESGTEATKLLEGTFSDNKNELLFTRFKVNYNNLPEYFKKGSVLVRTDPRLTKGPSKRDVPLSQCTETSGPTEPSGSAIAEADLSAPSLPGPESPAVAKKKERKKKPLKPFDGRSGPITILHTDIIKEKPFWEERPWLLE
ncbi:hypothetical protein CcaverHIS002_0203630 [Cutaneotrichosporon cavernicola]|uniref:tRNA(His) guanylyltransferase n=1 Tax=Cutaneotrichosporon cavernicola TaxID=279322 RepID=A0AA48KY46_9TREE|nr:uncharacterized protein CcaverHIS019_0203610 [Cutaneotrichosporon cavernicola]BEI81203.1 hypothetical protein CcaverHIS002_0203630 [Cutaneotrichosporon cavernicola]BEI88999.1 hypothetical protein CcaverHIS019_0203610 [Cutaneotrichosporon cavernicola]BEI96775.1 hypothetical protein CcaverHIS631_0203640 [Cutaneotrichosporon cavernicola]BEJ04547.1 hypothetical protein CcaverHIS641_0203640 [Cutaneotrichosporon cavernicola]